MRARVESVAPLRTGPHVVIHSSAVAALLAMVTLGAPVSADVLQGAPLASPGHSDGGEPPAFPCLDPRGCPDLFVFGDKLRPFVSFRNFAPTDCAVEEGAAQAGNRTLLFFNTSTPNGGAGDLIVGVPNPIWFKFAACHNHYHFEEFADYRLWTPGGYEAWNAIRSADPETPSRTLLAAHPELRTQLVSGHKQGFCLRDDFDWGATFPGKFINCNVQGISVGWADVYPWNVDGQWVDVTGLPTGPYVLEVEVNPARILTESLYANNIAVVPVEVTDPFVPPFPEP